MKLVCLNIYGHQRVGGLALDVSTAFSLSGARAADGMGGDGGACSECSGRISRWLRGCVGIL